LISLKRLWIITELFPPDETSTAYILGEIANACSKEYTVRVICGPDVYDSRKVLDVDHLFHLSPAIEVLRAEGLSVDKNTKAGKTRSFLAMSRRLYRLARKHIGTGDKVLLVTNPAPLMLLITRLRRRRTFEWNILVHDVFPENTIPAGLRIPGILYKLIRRLFDKAYSRADRIIALGRDMAEVLRRKVGGRVPIEIVENWADVDSIRPLPFPDGPIRLEYAGNIGRVQGLERLVSELPDGVELHFYGTGAMEDKLKQMAKPNVFFHGPYFRSQQQEVLGACHLAVVTLAEGMYGLGVPSKAYNIMAAGRPILYFGPADGEIGLMVREHRIGYIGWPEKWDLAEMEEMGKRARALAEQCYAKNVILDKFLAAIR
jgi:glycosyltransferase involved in cell wall biosynthesis